MGASVAENNGECQLANGEFQMLGFRPRIGRIDRSWLQIDSIRATCHVYGLPEIPGEVTPSLNLFAIRNRRLHRH